VIPPGPPSPGAGGGSGAGSTVDEGVVVVVVVGVVVVVVVVVVVACVGTPLPPTTQPTGNTSIAAAPNNASVVRTSDFMRNPQSRQVHPLIPRTWICETR
jgi:hypothetical protein